MLYPRGNRRASEGMISVHLSSELTTKIVVHFDVILMNKAGDRAGTVCSSPNKIEYPQPNKEGRGWCNFASREDILDESNNILNNGTLSFEIRIRTHRDYMPSLCCHVKIICC